VALGGGAYAQSKIGTSDLRNNAVGPKKIKRNAIGPRHIRRGAVRPPKVRNNSLRARKLRDVETLESSGHIRVDLIDSPTRLARSRRGNIVLRGRCQGEVTGTEAQILIRPAPPSGTLLAGTGAVEGKVFDGDEDGVLVEGTATEDIGGKAGSFSFISRGDVLQGTFHAAVEPGADPAEDSCLFAVSVSG